jgi:hypothetical protein
VDVISRILQLPSVIEVTTLRTAFPAYEFNVIMLGDKRRYEAVLRRDATGEIFCLISVNPREIYLELAKSPGVATNLNGSV